MSGQPKMTRLCLDPWRYLEITSSGLQPCCMITPIASLEADAKSLNEARDSDAFRRLRRQMLSGDLDPRCEMCHIRPSVPVEKLRKALQWRGRLAGVKQDDAALPLSVLQIEVTRDCNLRCVYCGVSQPHYVVHEMSREFIRQVAGLLENLPRNVEIIINGHGETTYHPDWLILGEKIAALGLSARLTTNLARLLKDEEAACLAHFRSIEVSIDSVDPIQLREVRRHVRLSNILRNIEKIRASAKAIRRREPRFTISCGVYDANFPSLEKIVPFCVDNRISSVTFWPLVKHADLPGVTNVYPVTSLPSDKIIAAVRHVETTLARLHEVGVRTVVAGEFLDAWREQAGLPPAGPRPRTMAVELRRLRDRIGDAAERFRSSR